MFENDKNLFDNNRMIHGKQIDKYRQRLEQEGMEDQDMSMKDMERMKQLLEEKKNKSGFLKAEKKIGSGKVEKMNKISGQGVTRTKKISQQQDEVIVKVLCKEGTCIGMCFFVVFD